MNVRDIDLFSPLIIVFIIILFLFVALIGIGYQMMGLKPVSITTYLYITWGILFFLLGYGVARYLNKYITRKNGSTGFRTFFDYIDNSRYFKEKIVLFIVLSALLVQFVNLCLLGGIPLLSGFLKAVAFNGWTIISYAIFLVSFNVLMARFFRKAYFILFFVGMVLFAATGYRAITLAIIISVLVTTFYTNEHKFKYFLLLSPIVIVACILIGYIACISIEWQQWNVNPFSLVFIRAGYTLTILNRIINLANTGGGLISYYALTGFLQSVDPRQIVGELVFKYNASITSTIFGPAILDFGYVGLAVQMFFLGLVLKLLHLVQKMKKSVYSAFYAIGLAHTMIWVETGPTDLTVWIYYLIAVIMLTQGFVKSNRAENRVDDVNLDEKYHSPKEIQYHDK